MKHELTLPTDTQISEAVVDYILSIGATFEGVSGCTDPDQTQIVNGLKPLQVKYLSGKFGLLAREVQENGLPYLEYTF